MMRILLAILLASCATPKPATPGDGAAAARTILDFDSATAVGANARILPAGFRAPSASACSSDPTRGFLREVGEHGLEDTRVPYQWAPIVPGPHTATPTVEQPEFSFAGTIVRAERSLDDLPFSHPFDRDLNLYVRADAAYRSMVANNPTGSRPADVLGVEISRGLYDETAFPLTPAPGDRVLLKGAWILDCGHPPYETELHPPTFMALARTPDAQTTLGLAIVNPYRETQLYHPDPARAVDFGAAGRFAEADARPFAEHLFAEVIRVISGESERLTAHAMMEATRFDALTWTVCAPAPGPAGGTLDVAYRFFARTGVAVRADDESGTGCVRFSATMSEAYRPNPITPRSVDWPWAEINEQARADGEAMFDVRSKIVEVLRGAGFTGDFDALREDRPPLINAFAPLRPPADDGAWTGREIQSDRNDQPYPFYGRIRVAWKEL